MSTDDVGAQDGMSIESPRTSPSMTATATPSPTWGRPKSPLPPHRLAKIANALGVSTPVPAVRLAVPITSRSWSEASASSDALRRSPSPSQSPSNLVGHSSVVSKYLLHVIPPLQLPHETDEDSDLTPPAVAASGYHTQFRRGTLVPLHPNFQSQLGAIAKEYALPSTAGLILYLVSSAKYPHTRSNTDPEEAYEPGPRLSEDIWRHLWTRVIKTEQRDDNLLSPLIRSPTPKYSPALTCTTLDANGRPLRPLISTVDAHQPRPITPIPPSPSTPSSISNPKSAPSSVSQSDPDTPDTSSASHSFEIEAQTRANSLDLPGLDSSCIIPILAKVEFDIDFRRAPWYDPWLRSRKRNHAKRAESRISRNEGGDSSDDAQEKHKRISFLTGKVRTDSPVSFILSPAEEREAMPSPVSDSEFTAGPVAEYEQLPDEGELSDSDSDEAFAEEITARVTSLGGKDPLTDVFGSDADTWAEIQQLPKRGSRRETNLNIVELALTGADLTPLPSPTVSEFEYFGREIDEVQVLLDRTSATVHRISSPTASKRQAPPPMILVPGPSNLAIPAETSPIPGSAGSVNLAYLQGEQSANDDEGLDDEYSRTRTTTSLEKREGAVYDDLDLGLEPSEDFDANDPNDRRRSQYLMIARLDQIERTMAQLSPRMLSIELEDDTHTGPTSSPNHSVSLSPRKYGTSPPPPRQDNPPSPPQLTLNGIAASAPPASAADPASPSKESGRWKRETGGQYPPSPVDTASPNDAEPIIPLSPDPFGRHPPDASQTSSVYWEKPPATFNASNEYQAGIEDRQNGARSESRATSRFSTDSLKQETATPRPATTFSAVSSFKKLWKKTGNRSSSMTNTSSNPPSSRAGTPTQAPPRPSQELPEGPPKTPTFGLFNLPGAAPRRSTDQPPPPSPQPGQQFTIPPPPQQQSQQHLPIPQQMPMSRPQQLHNPFNGRNPNPQPIRAAQMQPARNLTLNSLLFDQESPYPVRRAPSFPPRPLTPAAPSRHGMHLATSLPPPPPPPPLEHISNLPNPHMSPPSSSSSMPPSTSAPAVIPAQPPAGKPSIRKSILKSWKSGGSISSTTGVLPSSQSGGAAAAAAEPRASTERPNGGKPQSRRPSVLNFDSTRGSVSSPPPEIPPSPQIPQHFLEENRLSHKSRVNPSSSADWTQTQVQGNHASTSTGGSRPSMSSQGSEESRPSIDTSQFEIVSPKMSATLSYPYHELDQES